MVLTQPVLVQSFEDEFDLSETKTSKTPAPADKVLLKSEIVVDVKEHKMYQKGVGKAIHLTKYSRPEIANAV